MGVRLTILITLIVGAYAFLAFHLSEVQLMKGDYYTARAESEALATEDTTATRGAIYFTDRSRDHAAGRGEREFPDHLRCADRDPGCG